MKNKKQKQNKKYRSSRSDKTTGKRDYQKKAAKIVKEKLSHSLRKLGEE